VYPGKEVTNVSAGKKAKQPEPDHSDEPMSDNQSSETGELQISNDVLNRVVDQSEVTKETIADKLVVLHAALIGRHSTLEKYDYTTIDNTRAYRVPEAIWDDLVEEFEFTEEVATAVKFAHTEQAQLIFADATDVDDRFEEEEYGIVVGIETAEEF
jgi:hypothetical protein